jgi:HK97 family phage portal protein
VSLFGRVTSTPIAAPEERLLSFQDVWGSGGDVTTEMTTSGRDIGQSGLRLVPVYGATSLIADLVSTANWAAYRETPDGARTRLSSQPTLITNPSPYGDRISWFHQGLASCLLRGNAIGYITALDGQGRPAKVIWFHPDDVTIVEEQNDWFHTPTYYWRGRPLDRSLVVHVPGYTFPGSVKGFSPLALFKLQIETGLRAAKFGDDWFKNGAAPSGHLKNTARELDEDEAELAKTKLKSAVRKSEALVTGADWDWTSLSVKADEAQFLQTIKATATEVATIFRVSPEDIGGETGKSMTYKTLEQDNAKLTSRTLGVWAARFEMALTNLLPRPQYIKCDLDRLSRGDMTSRMIAHTAALSAGVETLDEARAAEDKPPLTPEQTAQWQEWFRSSKPVMEGVPADGTPSPQMGVDGGPNA